MRAALIALLLVGCGHTELSEIVLRPPTRGHGPVPVYVKGRDPDREYYDIALVQAVGSGGDADPEELVAKLAERAGILGCDAVVRLDLTQGIARTHAAGVCVRFTTNP